MAMTTTEDRDGRGGDDLPGGHSPGYNVPGNLTRVAEEVFHVKVRNFAAELANRTERVAHQAHHSDPQCTADDVHEAGRRMSGSGAGDPAGRKDVLAASLMTVATVGVPVMANFLHSPLQILIFGLFILGGLVGLGLTWIGRRWR
jgi:hypothetical protein